MSPLTASNEKNQLTSHIYVFFSGPYENVGDALIRRRALAWVRSLGEPHLLLGGKDSSDWKEALSIEPADVVYSGRGAWLKSALLSPGKRPVLVIEPGEFNTDKRFFKLLLVQFLVSVVVRARGGRVVQMPRSMARISGIGKRVYRATLSKSGSSLWREEQSWRAFRFLGVQVPDIGFDDPDSLTRPTLPRNHLVISLRSDRPEPALEMLEWLRKFALHRGLSITAVSQVSEDDSRTRFLAEKLGADQMLWADRTSNEQESILRGHYDRTALVWSDRLHVLVLGALHGAVPIEIVPSPNGKIPKHFDAIDIPMVSFDAARINSEGELHDILDTQLHRSELVRSRVEAARVALAGARTGLSVRKLN